MTGSATSELIRICREAAALVREVRDSRWPVLSPGGAPRTGLQDLSRAVAECRKCPLHLTRRTAVFGEGSSESGLMLIGEAPGLEEDRQGRPFVGAAGELLDRIIGAMGLQRRQVYIANVLKCRPPGNRNPAPEEISSCLPHLLAQVDLVRPAAICTLGKFAAQSLLGTQEPISRLRGRWRDFHGVPLMPTFHPAYLLRNPRDKHLVWQDVQKVMAACGLQVPEEKK